MHRSLAILLAAAFWLLCLTPRAVTAQEEGAFHAALRHLVAIPYCLLGGLLGPGCDPAGRTGEFTCRGTDGSGPGRLVTTAPNPYVAVLPSVTAEEGPGYVTYTLIYEREKGRTERVNRSTGPVVMYHSPLPFKDTAR